MAEVRFDGKKIARIDTGEIFTLRVSPGRHILGIAGDADGRGVCGLQMGQPLKEVATHISAGESQKFRISGAQDGVDIRPSSS